ncbi:MAG: M20/M25/M40 family metallo-hydrolase [Verrucomicrobia bacterium]|nr:M20/M25/M40 family metallo-hydrolase [Verrucomicrobiota bacterium]
MFDPVAVIADLVRAPSVSTDSKFAEGMAAARARLVALFMQMGLDVEEVPTPLHPAIFATRTGPADWPHVVIYGHYDVQPADPLDLWHTPAFEPTIKDGRMFGRGTADNKGPMMVHITAAARLLEKYPDLPLRLSFLIEGEEEIGSPSFSAILDHLGDRIKGDFVLLSDTQSPGTDQIAITTALRGITCVEVELSGASSDVHSGLHGGALLNPIRALCDLCSSLHNPDGTVNIPGFYDSVVPPQDWERAEIAKLQQTPQQYAESLGVKGFTSVHGLNPFEVTRLMPTLEFNGIKGGYQGDGSKTIIPSKASVKISCRLVANQDPVVIEQLVIDAIRARAPELLQLSIRKDHYGPPYRVTPAGKEPADPAQNPHLSAAFSCRW